jgi:signal transduction histidine kinase
MRCAIRQILPYFLCVGLLISLCLSVWSILRTDTYRQQTEVTLSQASEIRWRLAQSREKAARISGYLELSMSTGKNDPRLLQDLRLLRFNLKLIASLDYAAAFIKPPNMAILHHAIEAIDLTVVPVAMHGGNYEQALGSITTVDGYLVRLASVTVDYSQGLSATAQIATDAAHNMLVLFGAIAALILSIIAIWQHNKISWEKDQHIRSFSLLFAHMTRTRVAALRLFLGYLNGHSAPPSEMTNAAVRTIAELDSINEGLMMIGHARAKVPPAPLGQIINNIVTNSKNTLNVNADDEVRAVNVPASQFHLLLDELVLNAVNAVAGRTDPMIAITGTVRRRFLRRSQLILTVSDNGGGMSPDLLAKAKQPFFSTKAGGHVGLGLTNCVELMKTMAGRLDISSTPGKGTSVRIYYSI